MRRRDVLRLLGGAAASWPRTARAQQPAMPVVGLISATSAQGDAPYIAAFRQGLQQAGYRDGQNVAIDTEGPRGKTIDCRYWRAIWFGVR